MSQSGSSLEVVRFGVFEADLRTGELRKHGLRIKVQEQPFQVLRLLLAKPGELLTREELRRQLWPADTFVDFEHGLNKAINKLREALGDDRAKPLYIETLPRRGYRFIAPISSASIPDKPAESPAAPSLTPEPFATGSVRNGKWKSPGTILLLGLFGVGIIFLGYQFARRQFHSSNSTLMPAPIRSLAVLPLQNLSGDTDEQYFADGMTDELITVLGQMGALRVISRTSVMHYRGTTETLPQIGRELGADAIVEGTVFRSGNRVRITAQLVDARTDRHLWAHEYERDLRDVMTMQDEVARDIADEISVKLTPQERARLVGPHPVNPDAHEAYLKGLYYWNQFTAADVKKSGGFFRQAIREDPNYALGYSGLANYYGVMYVRFDAYSRNEACPQEEAAALEAVRLDDSSAEAHHSLAGARMFCDWDLRGAEGEFKRAIQLNPNYAEAHRVYANLLASSGRTEQAEAEAQRAVENDPMSPDLNMILGWIYYLARDYDRSFAQLRKAENMGPERPEVHWGLGNVYVQKKQFDLAIREYGKAVQLSRGAPWALSSLGHAEALAGKRREALEILKRLSEMSKHRPVEPLQLAAIYIGLSDKDQALAWIEKAYAQHDWGMLGLKVEPKYDGLRSDPRFQAFLRRMNFPH